MLPSVLFRLAPVIAVLGLAGSAQAQERNYGQEGPWRIISAYEKGSFNRCIAEVISRNGVFRVHNFPDGSWRFSVPCFGLNSKGTIAVQTSTEAGQLRVFTNPRFCRTSTYALPREWVDELRNTRELSVEIGKRWFRWNLAGLRRAMSTTYRCVRALAGPRPSVAQPRFAPPPAPQPRFASPPQPRFASPPPPRFTPPLPAPQRNAVYRFDFARAGMWDIKRVSAEPSGRITGGCTADSTDQVLLNLRLAVNLQIAFLDFRDGTDMRKYPQRFPVQIAFGTNQPFQNHQAEIITDNTGSWARVAESRNLKTGIDRADQVIIKSAYGFVTIPMFDRDKLWPALTRCMQLIR